MLKQSTTYVLAASALGLASIAQAADFEVTVTNITSGVYFTPLIAGVHPADAALFEVATVASPQLQDLAESGSNASTAELLESIGASVATGSGLLAPGQSATLMVSTSDANTRLSVASMLLPTNDGFLGLNAVSLPSSMGVTEYHFVRAYDSGTEANNELVGSFTVGEPGFPVPPPLAATGTLGSGGHGVPASIEGFVSVHRGVLGDLDPVGGYSDINAAVHTFNSPVARIAVRMVGDGGDNGSAGNAPSAVASFTGVAYSSSALEVFWEPATSSDSIVTLYEVRRDGELVASIDGLSFFEEGLAAGTEFTYTVRAIDANGNAGENVQVVVRTNDS